MYQVEEDNNEFVVVVPGNGDGADEYDNRDDEAEDGGNDCKPAALLPLGGGICIGRHDNNDSNDDSDCKEMMTTPTAMTSKDSWDNNGRLLCFICLEAVSKQPVVTCCIHLNCWTCLYTWLEPSIEDREYSAAFGGGGGGTQG
jgi:hypothetical protein